MTDTLADGSQRLRLKLREEILRSAAILRPDELATSVDAVLDHWLLLTAAIAVETKPVAWRWRHVETPRIGWLLGTGRPVVEDEPGWEIQPLYASPQPLLDAPRVRALEWVEKQSEDWSGPIHQAYSLGCHYTVVGAGDRWMLLAGYHREGSGPCTLDEAKAAAQADYEQRILSALQSDGEGK